MRTSNRLSQAGLIWAVLAVAAILWPGQVRASGFHVYEQGAKASGQAVAFTARADDASSVYYNPAAMVHLGRPHAGMGVSGVFLGSTTFDSDMDVVPPPFTGSGDSFDMKDETVTPLHLYFVQPFGGRYAAGIGLTNPFGLVTDWSMPDFDGRYSAVRTDLRTFLLNLNAAMEISDGISVAAGLDYILADLGDFSRRIPIFYQQQKLGEALSNLTGDGGALGWNAAAHFRQPDWAAGASLRSGFSVDLDGDLIFSDVPPEVALLLKSTPAEGPLDLPATLAVGFAYTGLERWEFELDMHWIGWSAFDKVEIDVKNETDLVRDNTVNENWDDTFSFRLGTAWAIAPRHEVRAGLYAENSPIPLETLRPSIPDADRIGLTLGYGLRMGKVNLDGYFMHIMLEDVTVGLRDQTVIDPAPMGTYESSIDLAGVSATMRF